MPQVFTTIVNIQVRHSRLINYIIFHSESDEEEVPKYPWQRPDGGVFAHLWWALFFPVELLFFLTIPDVRR